MENQKDLVIGNCISYAQEEQFYDVLYNKKVSTVFQPIVSLRDGSVFGYEALSRGPAGTVFQSPALLIEYAEKKNLMFELEYLFRHTALQAASSLAKKHRLFLNVNPNIIQSDKFKDGFTREYLDEFCINPEMIVFEITERESVHNIAYFKNIIEHYKNQNYKIAIDDAGAGYSGLNLISDVHPHFIKLDMCLIRDIDKDVMRQALIKGMAEFANLSNTYIIAEGVETAEELAKLIEFDIAYAQGFFIQRPSEKVQAIDREVLEFIEDCNRSKNRFFGTRVNDFYIQNIARNLPVVSRDILVSQLDDFFQQDTALPGVCVVESEVPVGVVTRHAFYNQLGGKYGYSLFAGKSVEKIMESDFLSVDCKTTIDIVAKKAMSRPVEQIYDFITVTGEGSYYGVVTVKDLLDKSIALEVANAKSLNPLSELPGNALIEVQLEKAVNFEQKKYILYFDIDNFKAYNDFYGFEHGDNVLKYLTRILKECAPAEQFLGHIGGDDFICVLDTGYAENMCQCVLEKFDAFSRNFYTFEDASRGYIAVKNRKGIEENFPLMSLSIVGVYAPRYQNIFHLAEAAGKLKKLCKQKIGSNYMLEEEDDGMLLEVANTRAGGEAPQGGFEGGPFESSPAGVEVNTFCPSLPSSETFASAPQ